jgi:intein/homing endonuclease
MSKLTVPKLYSPQDIDNMVENEYLGFPADFNEDEMYNILLDASRSKDFDNNPVMDILDIMSKPEYFYYTCKWLLNIHLLPFQVVMLQELWVRKFPMLLATRGGGKCITGDSIIQLSDRFVRIGDYVGYDAPEQERQYVNDHCLGENGYNEVEYCWNNGTGDVITTKTRDGFELTGVPEHKIRIVRDGAIEWCELADVRLGDYAVISRHSQWHSGDSGLSNNDMYILGCLVGDGGEYTKRGSVTLTSADESIRDLWYSFAYAHCNKKPVQYGKYDYCVHSTELWTKLFSEFGFNSSVCADKDFPDVVFGSSKEAVSAFIRGLMDTDGEFDKHDRISFCSKSESLVKTLQTFLLKFGVVGIKSKKWNKKYQRHYHVLRITGHDVDTYMDEIGFALQRKSERYKRKKRNTNIDIVPRSLWVAQYNVLQPHSDNKRRFSKNPLGNRNLVSYDFLTAFLDSCVTQQDTEEWQSLFDLCHCGWFFSPVLTISSGVAQTFDVHIPDNHSFISNGFVSHNTWILSLYAMLRAIFNQGSKIVVVGAAFRQAKLMFEYMEQLWRGAPILRNMVGDGKHQGPKRDIDRCMFYVGDSEVCAIPMGDGSKIRGLRAHYTIADEFACLEGDSIVETSDGFVRISDFDHVDYVLTGDDKLSQEAPDKFIKTPYTDVYEVKLSNGYVIRCSENHQIMTNNGWKKPLELSEDDYVEQAPSGHARFGTRYVDGLKEKEAWLLGTLISEDCVTDTKRISVTTTDIDTCMRLVNEYNFKFKVVAEYVDKRDWNCKKAYKLWKDDETLRNQMKIWGLDYVTAHDKKIPHAILRSPESVIQHFLSGLFDVDGSCFLWQDRDIINRIGLAYYSVSERLCRDVQFLMYKLGFDGYINHRTSEISDNLQWFVRWNGEQARTAAVYLMINRFADTIKQCYVADEPKNYCWDNSRKKWKVSIVYCGQTIQKRFKSERQAIDFVDSVRNRTQYRKVISVTLLPYKKRLYDYHLPITHSFYAEGHRQHNSIPLEIFEVVIKGFSSVSASPAQRTKDMARIKVLKSLGMYTEADDIDVGFGNQTVISGTAYYSFNHFYDYWKRYKQIIESKGDNHLLEAIFKGEVPEGFDWKQFSIFRVPWQKLPYGFMDETQIHQAKATVHRSTYLMEYGAAFAKDSDGFFKRSLIENCVCKSPIELPSGPVQFSATIRGNPNCRYVYGIDPASEKDNFAIIVLEIHPDHRRIVYAWSINRQKLRERIKQGGKTTQKSFYTYCARKIRDLMKVFPTEHIAIDTQGGGIAIMEALHDPDEFDASRGEKALWPYIRRGENDVFWWEQANKPTDGEIGLHILHMVQFANADFTRDANHFMRKDFESRSTLFPMFDPATISEAISLDKIHGRDYDTLEDCVMDIEELKDELATIVHDQTAAGRDRWDTPEVKLPGNKKGRLRKDRYSALLIANIVAHVMENSLTGVQHEFVGGFAGQRRKTQHVGRHYIGPEHIVSKMNCGHYGKGVVRR